MVTRWADVPGFEGRYQVSDQGIVMSLPFLQRYLLRTGAEAFRRTKAKPIQQLLINSGYYTVNLWLDDVGSRHLVHRLVADAFCHGKFSGADVNHKNGVKTDNSAENLEWATRTENHLHAVREGLNKQAIRVTDPATGATYPSISQAAKGAHKSHRAVAATFVRSAL